MGGHRRRILLVEDDAAHAEAILRILREHGDDVGVERVSDGEEALSYLLDRGADEDLALILLDLRLPKVDGLEVLDKIKEDPALRTVPVVILTTSDADADRRAAYARYANSYLVKPNDYEEFVELVRLIGTYWLDWNRSG